EDGDDSLVAAVSGPSAILIQPPSPDLGTTAALNQDPASARGIASSDPTASTATAGSAAAVGPAATESSSGAGPAASGGSASSGQAENVSGDGWETLALGIRQKVKTIDGYLDELAAAVS